MGYLPKNDQKMIIIRSNLWSLLLLSSPWIDQKYKIYISIFTLSIGDGGDWEKKKSVYKEERREKEKKKLREVQIQRIYVKGVFRKLNI